MGERLRKAALMRRSARAIEPPLTKLRDDRMVH
jgi:hypothetical protein